MLTIILTLFNALFLTQITCGSQAWNNIQTGKITPITIFSGNISSSVYSFSVTTAEDVTLMNPEACVSVISYNVIVSVSMAFNSSITSLNATQMVLRIETFQSTYFAVLSYHYLVHAHPTLQIKYLCYYTNTLLVGTGIRNQTFTNSTTNFTGSFILTTTTLSGFLMNNTLGQFFNLTVSSSVASGVITTMLATSQKNLVEWVCVNIIVYNSKATIAGEFYFKDSSLISHSLMLSNLQTYNAAFLISNTMFFGLSSLLLTLNLINTQILSLSTEIVSNPQSSPTINQNQDAVILEQFFIWTDTCMSDPTKVVPTSGFTCSTGCASTEYKTVNNYCLSCAFTSGHCKTCSNTMCLSCDPTSPTFRNAVPVSGVCVCLNNFFDLNGVCTLCNISIPNCATCTSQTTCTFCNPGFVQWNGLCYCSGTYMANGTCSPLAGCLNVSSITSGAYCLNCDTASNFYTLVNRTCACLAHTHFNNYTGKCDGDCGDGYAIGNDCDLGPNNGVSGSGCLTNCTWAPNFYCSNPNLNNVSICVNISSFSAQYLYSYKELSANTADIYLQLSPNSPVLAQMNFSKLIKSSIPTSALSATYDNNTGILLIKATYLQSIEGTNQMLNISFDTTKIYAPSVVLNIQTCGLNAKLQFNVFETYNNTIYYVAMFTGALALLFAIISGILGFKLIGWQICLPVQLAYFSLSLVSNETSPLNALNGLTLSTGYNQLTSFSVFTNLGIDQAFINLARTYEFLANCNFTYTLFLTLLALALITKNYVEEKLPPKKEETPDSKKKKKTEEEQEKAEEEPPVIEEVSKVEKAHYFIIDKLLINVCILLLLNAVFSFCIQAQKSPTSSTQFSSSLNIALSLLMLTLELGGFIFIILKIKDKDRHYTFKSESRYYPIVYIAIQILTVGVIATTYYTTSFSIFFTLLPQTILLYFFIKLRPHGKFISFNNLACLYCQIIPASASAFLILNEYLTLDILPTVSAFCIIGLSIIGEGLSIVRLVLKYREESAKEKEKAENSKVKEQTEHLQALAYSSIKNQLINQSKQSLLKWDQKIEDANNVDNDKNQMGKQSKYLKLNERGQDSEEQQPEGEEQDELRKIKMRLRKEIYEKRNFDL